MHSFEQQRKPGENPKYTTAALKRGDELDIDLSYVPGTGSNGRITRDDVEAYAEKFPHRGGQVDDDVETPSPPEPGEHIVPPEQVLPAIPGASSAPPVMVEPDESVSGLNDRFREAMETGCVCFYCPTNPNFNLQSHKLGDTIYFTDGCYETSDPAEIAALRACQSVEEVSE